MGERAGGRETRDRRRLASRRVPLVLALPFAPPFWPTENHPRASPSDPVYGGGEPTWGAPRIHGELLKLGFETPSPPSPATWRKGPYLWTPASAGSAFSRTIVRPSPPWTFSPCPPRPSGCCTASS